MGRRRQSKKRTTILAIWLAFILITVSGCSTYASFSEAFLGEEPEEDVVRIGVFEPLSGSDEEAARLEVMGIELAHNLYPTVLGKRVELVYADNKSDITVAESAAQTLVDKKVDVILGSYGNTLSMAGGQYFHKAMIPAIAITCTNPLVTKGNAYYFRISIVDSFQGIMAAKYVFDELGLSDATILKQADDDYGAALSQQFADKLASLAQVENAILATVEYKKDTVDYEKELMRVKASGAEVVYLPCPAKEGAEIIRQARKYGVDALFIGTDLWHDESFIETGGQAVEGAVFTTYFDAESAVTEKTRAFLATHQIEYGDKTAPHSSTALGFDAYLLALDAIERHAELKKVAEKDPEGFKNLTLRDVLAQTREYAGATGSISFDENGDPIKSVVMITVEKGEFKHKTTVHPEWNESEDTTES
ncbi:MAG: ABC transporter substrate-binding protein [Anaerovoracaceae bacterium]|jgi:branched-chain amino acid transport system substrate-binding protein